MRVYSSVSNRPIVVNICMSISFVVRICAPLYQPIYIICFALVVGVLYTAGSRSIIVRMHVSGFIFSCFVVKSEIPRKKKRKTKSEISTDTLPSKAHSNLPTLAHNANSLRDGANAHIAKVYIGVSTATILQTVQSRAQIKLVCAWREMEKSPF